jgi:hypothetical protein
VEKNWYEPVWISVESSVYQIQAVIQIAGKAWEYSVSIFHLFIYYAVACDIMNREKNNVWHCKSGN